jgi:hypothetical protein
MKLLWRFKPKLAQPSTVVGEREARAATVAFSLQVLAHIFGDDDEVEPDKPLMIAPEQIFERFLQ